MAIEVSSNAEEVAKRLLDQAAKMRQELKFTVFRALTLLEGEILQNLRGRSGLKVRTGNLLNSIGASKKVIDNGDTVEGEIGPQGVAYAAIHEFGGKTSPHRIDVRNRRALKFVGNAGADVFARFVNHPGSQIPARPYLRPALAAKEDQIMRDFGLFISAAFKTKGD